MASATTIVRPRLHHVNPTSADSPTATSTPTTTATTRSMALRTACDNVTCATSRAVSGASTDRGEPGSSNAIK